MISHLRVVDSTHLVVSTHNPPLSQGTNVIMIFDLNMVVKKNESISRIGQYWPITFGGTTQPMPNRRGATACVEVLLFPYSSYCGTPRHATETICLSLWMDIHKICSRGLTTFNRIKTLNASHPSTPEELSLRTTSWCRFINNVHICTCTHHICIFTDVLDTCSVLFVCPELKHTRRRSAIDKLPAHTAARCDDMCKAACGFKQQKFASFAD